MKKVLLILMAIAICVTSARANEIIGNFEYNVTNNTAYGVSCAILVGPTQAFLNSNPTRISIPGYITTSSGTKLPVFVGSYAFSGNWNYSVTEVWMDYGVLGIGYHAFSYLSNLNTVHIPSSVKGIGDQFLYSSGEGAMTLTINWATLDPGSVNISDDAFGACTAFYGRKVNMPTYPAITKAKNISKLTQYFTVNTTPAPTSCYDYTYNQDYFVVSAENASTGEVALVGSTKTSISIAPSTYYYINAKPYYPTSVAQEAFKYNTTLGSINITKTTMTIEKDAFAYSDLTSATVYCSQILEEAFYNCNKLTSMYLGEGVTYVASRAFTACKMTTLNIPSTLQTFAVTAVNNCYNLQKFTVASGNTKYATYSTYGSLYSKDLKTLIKVPAMGSIPNEGYWNSELTTIFDYAFSDHRNSYYVHLPYGVTTINSCAFENATIIQGIKIPSSVTSIDYHHAFYGCTGLKHLLVATYANRTNVDAYTFYNTPSNLVVHVPSDGDGPPYRDDAAFYSENYWKDHNVTYGAWDVVIDGYPYILAKYYVDDNNQYKAADLVYGTNLGSTDYTLLKSGAITIPKTFSYKGTNYEVMRIGGHAFKGNTQITSVTFSQVLMTTHGGSQFQNCTALKNVYFNHGNHASAFYTDIPNNCFRNTRLTSIALPYGVRSVGDQAFADNPSLTEIRIPSYSYSFVCPNFVRNCSKLSRVYMNRKYTDTNSGYNNWPTYDTYADPDNSTNGCFYNVPTTCKLYVPVGAINNYYNVQNHGGYYPWRHFSTIKAGAYDYDGMTVVDDEDHDFVTGEGYIKAKYVYAPESFPYHCSGILVSNKDTEFVRDEYNRCWKVVELDDSCFAGSTYVKSVTIDWDDNVITKIPDFAFRNCTNLKTFTWPTKANKLTYIGKRAFENSGLEGVVDLTKCGTSTSLQLKDMAFYKSQKVTDFKLPANISIGEGAMFQTTANSPKLQKVTCKATTPPNLSSSNSVWNIDLQPSQTLYVPKTSINAYKAAAQWKYFGTITAIVDGDVNGDGLVSSVDVTALYNYLLNNDSSAIVNGDLDGDGIITSVDITIIYNILLGN